MRSAVLSISIILYCVVGSHQNWQNNQIIDDYKDVPTQYGVVRGHLADNNDYIAFLGIPYAAPPTGTNRFKAPLPPTPWEGVYEANRTVRCPQNGDGDEDCLILNIFTPTQITDGPLPVLFYIHGGAFTFGVGQSSGAEPMTSQNVILVTMNYRLGVFGFLCLGTEEAPGNAALKDQAAAMKWVHDNIENFGGDPKQVTIYGVSAGGVSVELQVLSKTPRGLFHRAIVESATSAAVWTADAHPIATARELAKILNFPDTTDLDELVQYYQQISVDELSVGNYEYHITLTDGTIGFVPCIERPLPGVKAFLDEPPYEILTYEKFNKVPMIFLLTTLEGKNLRSSQYYEFNYKERVESNFIDFMPSDLIFDSEELRTEVAKKVKYFYFGNRTVGDDTIIEYLNFFGDYIILHGLLNSAEKHSIGGNPVYLMDFAYKGDLNNYDSNFIEINVAGHGDVVKHAILNKEVTNDNDQLTVDRISTLVANFVKYGNPTPSQTDLLPIIWPTVRPDKVSYLHLNQEFSVSEKPYWDRKLFWDRLYSRYRMQLKAVDPRD